MTTAELCIMCKKPTLKEVMGFELGMIFQCGNCGYRGPLRLLVDEPSQASPSKCIPSKVVKNRKR